MSTHQKLLERMNYQVFNDEKEGKNQEIREPLQSIALQGVALGTVSDLSFEQAKNHQQAVRITKVLTEEKGGLGELPSCPCCGNLICNELIPYNADLKHFYHLGPAIPLYVDYLKNAIYFLGVQFLFFGLYCVYSFYQGNYCNSDEHGECPDEFLNRITFANILDNPMDYGHDLQDLLAFLLLIVMIGFSQIIAYRHEKLANEIDMHNDTPSDYAIRIRGLPIRDTQGNLEERLEKVFHGYGLDIVKVVIVYDVKKYINLLRRWKRTEERLLAEEDPQKKEQIQKEYNMLMDQIQKTFQERKIKEKTSGNAFLILDNQEQVDLLLKNANRTWVERLFGSQTINKVDGKTYELPSKFYFEGKNLVLEKAPEPSDIFWENLTVSNWKRIPNMILTVLVSSVIIIVGVCILVAMNHRQMEIEEIVSDDIITPEETEFMFKLQEAVLPLVIVGLNIFVRVTLKILVSFERPETYTDYMIDATAWQIFVKFINSVMNIGILILSEKLHKPAHVIAGLIMNVVIANSILPAFINLFVDPDMLLYIFQRWYGTRLAKKRKITQEQLNHMFEYPELDYIDRYSTIYLILILCSVFTPVVPVCPLIGAFGITLVLLVDKFVITRRTTISKDLGGELSYVMTLRYDLCIILFAISKYLWEILYMKPYSTVYNESGILQIATIILLVIYIIFPMRLFFKGLINFNKLKRSNTKYVELKKTLMNDYDQKNPVSYIEKMQGSTSSESKDTKQMLDNLVKYTVSYDLENKGLYNQSNQMTNNKKRLRDAVTTIKRKTIKISNQSNPQNPTDNTIEMSIQK